MSEQPTFVECPTCELFVRATVEYGPAKYGQDNLALIRYEPHRTLSGMCGAGGRGYVMPRDEVKVHPDSR